MTETFLKVHCFGEKTIALIQVQIDRWPYRTYKIIVTPTDDSGTIEFLKEYENTNNNKNGRWAAEAYFDGYVDCYE